MIMYYFLFHYQISPAHDRSSCKITCFNNEIAASFSFATEASKLNNHKK